MILRRFWRNFRVTNGGGILWEESIPKWFSISKHNFVFCIYLVKSLFYGDFDEIFGLPEEEEFYEENQFQNGFWFRAIISFFAYISWNKGFTAILTKFLPYSKGEEFYKKNQFPNGFRFRSLISFFAYISWNNAFTETLTKFSCHQRGGILWEESIPKWLSISNHNFDFCIYLVK